MTKIISSRFETDLLYYRLHALLEEMSDVAEAEVIGEMKTSEDVMTALELMMTKLGAEYLSMLKMHSSLATDFMSLSAENVRLSRDLAVQKKQIDLAVDVVTALTEPPKDSIIIDDVLDVLIESSNAKTTSEFSPPSPNENVDVDTTTIDDCYETVISAEKNDLRVGLKKALHTYSAVVARKAIDASQS